MTLHASELISIIKEGYYKKPLTDTASEIPCSNGGVVIKKSSCCSAPVAKTSGGVIFEYCTKCNRSYEEPTFG